MPLKFMYIRKLAQGRIQPCALLLIESKDVTLHVWPQLVTAKSMQVD